MDAIGSGRLPQVDGGEQESAESGGRLAGVSEEELHALVRRLAPPSSIRRPMTRMIHPDQMVFSFSVMILLFVLLMLGSQPQLLIPVGGILLLCYLFYLMKRPQIIQRFEREVLSFNDSYRKTEAAIGIWLKLYYCGRDEGVFIPGEEVLIPLDEMGAFLSRRGIPPLSGRARTDQS